MVLALQKLHIFALKVILQHVSDKDIALLYVLSEIQLELVSHFVCSQISVIIASHETTNPRGQSLKVSVMVV
jgi:hypothetical protein